MTSDTRGGDWTSNADAAAVAARLKSAKRVAVLTHAKPDGDAAGSALALVRSLLRAGVRAEAWFIGPQPRWLAEIAADTPVRLFRPRAACGPDDGKTWPLAPGDEPDAVAVVDTGTWSQVTELEPFIRPRRASVVIVDHHVHGDSDMADMRHVRTECASTTQILAPICAAVVGVKSAAELPRAIAEPLYLGLATDTGWFKYSNVTPEAMALGAELLAAGVDHTRLYQMIEQQDQPPRWKLLGRALNSLEVFDGGRVAVMRVTLRDFAETGATGNDTGGFADMTLTIATVRVAALLSEAEVNAGEPPMTKVSMRSKPPGGPGGDAVDVNAVCMKLGGGGHVRAAGAKIRAGLDEAKRQLLEALK